MGSKEGVEVGIRPGGGGGAGEGVHGGVLGSCDMR